MSEESYEGIRHTSKVGKPTYVMVPRKLIIFATTIFASMLIMTILSIQWASYIDRRSNQRWCGIVNLFNDTYETTPPTNDIGRKLEIEFKHLETDFKCK